MDSTPKPTPPPWCWLSPDALVGAHGHRPVILAGTKLMERGDDGRLHPLNTKGPNARLIVASPKLLAFIERYYEAWKDYDDVNEDVEKMVADAKALIDEVKGTSPASLTEAAERDFDMWAYQRLSALVTAGREDLRNLRNRFGMSVQGKLIHASAITDKERDDAKYHINEDRS